MADAAPPPPPARSSRFWLFAPIVLLLVVAAGWSAAWFAIEGRAAARLDAFRDAEARAGRDWRCKDRSIGGFPFRLEVICADLTVVRDGVTVSLGRVETVAQVYDSRFVIALIDGPMTASDGHVTVQGSWRLLEASVRGAADGLQRLSVVADAPRFVVAGVAPQDVVVSADRFEAHLRPNLARAQDGAFDVALRLKSAQLPALDEVLGDPAPTSLEADATVTQALAFRRQPIAIALDDWRQAGGRLDLLEFSLAKGGKRIDAKGSLALDALHRPAGDLTLATAGLESLIASLAGNGLGGTLLGGLFGGGGGPPPAGGGPALRALPPLRLENGRILVGPFAVPRLRLAPLY